jgi:Flp pilus assembly protein TadG
MNAEAKAAKHRGFVILMTAVSAVVLVGMLGLAVDLGRVYIVKNEAQGFADIAALSAARKLDGTSTGIDNAKTEVTNSTNKYDFGTKGFGTANAAGGITTVEFADCSSTHLCGTGTCTTWTKTPSSPYTNIGCVRVTVSPAVNLSFMPYLGTGYTQTVKGQAVAATVPQSFPLGGYMPFSPFAHVSNCTSLNPNLPSGCDATGNYGFSIGQEYGFHWPGSAKTSDLCAGDKPSYNFSNTVAGSIRGYFELQSASAISAAILGETQTLSLSIGDALTMTNGNKQAEAAALTTRASYDTDQTDYSNTPNGIAPPYVGNGMRKVVMPVNNGPSTYVVEGFASFLLYPSYSVGGGNQVWCAIYMGTNTQGGTGGVFNIAGAYVVRLTQ